jgi:hypothetical protein
MIEVIIPANTAAIEEGDFHAGIRIYGLEYACSYVAGEYRVRNVSGINYSSNRPAWQIKKNAAAAREWLEAEVAKLGAAFLEAHNRLYKLDRAA